MCIFQGERLKTDLKSKFQPKQADFNTVVQKQAYTELGTTECAFSKASG